MKKNKVIIIGSGFSGLASAISLADKGFNVTILEKNSSIGGRSRVFKENGFTFDMGPSWYWMPDVFEDFFNKFGKKVSDYYNLVRLDPSYRVFFGKDDFLDLSAKIEELKKTFEKLEKGSSAKLDEFLKEAEYKYKVGMGDFVHKPSLSVNEFIDKKLLVGAIKLDILESFEKHIRKYFKNKKILKIIEFPILFLGATPKNTPAMYSLMNYADINLGTWYPMDGMFKIIEAMTKLAEEKGVKFELNTEVKKIEIENNMATKVLTNKESFESDVVVASADYHHVEKNLIDKEYRNYDDKYWEKRVMSPSSLIFYLGVNKKLNNLLHHNLFFDSDFKIHAQEIYDFPQWPSNPLFYVCAPSKTDPNVSPEGYENLFILIPVATDLKDTEKTREHYYNLVMERLEKITKQEIKNNVVLKKSYAHNDFKLDYNAFKGNAYGLANILSQTAIFKPSIRNKKVKNIFFTGQLTVPGPGVPPSIISGQIVAKEIEKEFMEKN
mgnify:CR=1 FL=1